MADTYYILHSLRSLGLSKYEANFTASNVDDSQVQNLIQHSSKRGQRDCEWLESLIPEKSHRREFIQEFRRLHHIQSRISDARSDISLAETDSVQDEEEEGSEGEAAAAEEEEEEDPEVKISYSYPAESHSYNYSSVTRRNYNNLDHHAMFTQYRTPENNSLSGSGSGSGSGAGAGTGDSSFLTSSFSVIDHDLSEMEGLEPDWGDGPSGSGSARNETSASISNMAFPRRWLQKTLKLFKLFSISGQILLVTISLIIAAAFAPLILPHVLELTSGGLNVLNVSFQTVYRNGIRYYLDVNVNYKSSIKSNFFHHDKEDYRDRRNDRDSIIETLIFYERVRSYQAFLLGPDDLDTLHTQYMIGDLLIKDQVELMSEAIRLLANVHNKRAALLGEEHPETLLTKVNLANALQIKDLIGIGKLQQEQWKQELQACDILCGQDNTNRLANTEPSTPTITTVTDDNDDVSDGTGTKIRDNDYKNQIETLQSRKGEEQCCVQANISTKQIQVSIDTMEKNQEEINDATNTFRRFHQLLTLNPSTSTSNMDSFRRSDTQQNEVLLAAQLAMARILNQQETLSEALDVYTSVLSKLTGSQSKGTAH